MNKGAILGILGGIIAAVVLGIGLSSALPGLLTSGSTSGSASSTESVSNAISAQLAGEKGAPALIYATMPISQVDFDEGSTNIPVKVQGTTADGESYSRLHFVNGVGDGIRLVPGEYYMSIPAGYITGQGVLYLPPTDDVHVKIPIDTPDGEYVQATIYIPNEQRQDNYVNDEIRERVEALAPGPIEMLTFSEVPLVDITESMLDEIVDYAKQDPTNNGRAEKAKEVVLQAQKKLLKEQEEAKRKAEEEEAKREQERLVEEQRQAAREAGRQALEDAKKQAEAEQKASDEAASAAAKSLSGWWGTEDGSIRYHFHNGIFDVYYGSATTSSGSGAISASRLTADQAATVGGDGYLLSVGGPQSYVLFDNGTGVLECRSTADLSLAAAGNLSPTTAPEQDTSSAAAQDDSNAASSTASSTAA